MHKLSIVILAIVLVAAAGCGRQTPSISSSPQSPARAPVPIKVAFRKALTGPGYVAVISTTVKEDFPVVLTIRSKQLNTENRYRVDLTWTADKEIGYMEAMPIDVGDTLRFSNVNYSDVVVVCPSPPSNGKRIK